MIISVPLEERLIRFPNLFVQSYEFRAHGRFSESSFLDALLGAYWMTNVPSSIILDHEARPVERVHGPFDLEALSRSDYVEVALAEVAKRIRGQVNTDSVDPGKEWLSRTFPDPPSSGRRLDALLDALAATNPICYRLGPSILGAGDDTFSDQFSQFQSEIEGPLEHFEEWVTCSPESEEAYVLILACD